MLASTPLTVEVSIAETINVEDDDVPEPSLLEKWAATAYIDTSYISQENKSSATTCFINSDFINTDNESLPEKLPAIVSFRITDTAEIQQLNFQFRNKNQPTNVLSFPMQIMDAELMDAGLIAEMNGRMLGDIVLCAAVIKQQAKTQAKTIESHWAHMIVHGMLHLQGYDHIEAVQAEVMEKLEISLLKQLGYANPYHG